MPIGIRLDLCSAHFTEQDFRYGNAYRTLERDATPSVFAPAVANFSVPVSTPATTEAAESPNIHDSCNMESADREEAFPKICLTQLYINHITV
jgi:hypothetical protein